jgi:hypothetical protein
VPERARSRLIRIVYLLVPSANPARHVDGLILMAALLAVESTRHESLAQAAGAAAIVIVLLWLSHTYAETLAERLELGHPLSAGQLRQTASHEMSLLRGAFIPLIVLLVGDALGLSVHGAVIAALLSAIVLIFVIEMVAAWRGNLARSELAFQVGVGVLIGGGVEILHVIL